MLELEQLEEIAGVLELGREDLAHEVELEGLEDLAGVLEDLAGVATGTRSGTSSARANLRRSARSSCGQRASQ